MNTAGGSASSSTAILTVPNAISFARILSIPLVWMLIVRPGTTTTGVLVFATIVATDWVDGVVARRTGQVSELGKVLDPLADRLVIAAGLVALVVRGAFPGWAAAVVLVRDAAALLIAAGLLARRRVRLEVRPLGKLATFTLMAAIPAVALGTLGVPGAEILLALGWAWFAVGVIESYVAAALYLTDVRRSLAGG